MIGKHCKSIHRDAKVLEEIQQVALEGVLEGLVEQVKEAAPKFEPTQLAQQAQGTRQWNRQPSDATHKPLQERFPKVTGKPRTVERGGWRPDSRAAPRRQAEASQAEARAGVKGLLF